MSAAKLTAPLFPPEDLASQLSTIEVLLSIYHGNSDLTSEGEEINEDTGDVILSPETYNAIKDLAEFLSLPLKSLGGPHSIHLRDSFPAVIQIGIKLDPLRGTHDEDGITRANQSKRYLVLNVGFALRRLHERKQGSLDETLKPRWNLKCADWMDRSSYDSLCASATNIEWSQDENVDYIMNVIEAISEASLKHLYASNESRQKEITREIENRNVTSTTSKVVLRSWYLLPSLSMKEKRKDLVSYAHSNDFTGFILAGRPGIVVLECDMSQGEAHAVKSIDSYWSEIKKISWSDLPSAHMKVSERYREEGVHRCFTDMSDVTNIDELGGVDVEEERRICTPNFDQLKSWLQLQGCDGQLDVVLGKEISI